MRAESRTLQYALLCSVLLHALMLFSTSALKERRHAESAPAPLVARLVEDAPPQSPPETKPSLQEEPPPQAKPQRQAKPQATEQPRSQAKSRPKPGRLVAKPVPVVPPRTAVKAAPPPSAPSMPPASPPAVPARPSAPSFAKAGPQPAPAAASARDQLRAYRERIHDAAARYKHYPRAAMDNDWHGRVLVRLVVGRDGMIASLTVADTSGHAILDRQAMDTIRKAKGAVPIPAAWRGRQFSIELPVIYSLDEPGEGAR